MRLFPLALAALSFSAQADQVILENGDRLSGTVVRKDDEYVILRTSYAGEISIRTGEVHTVLVGQAVEDRSTEAANLQAGAHVPTGTLSATPEPAHGRDAASEHKLPGSSQPREGRISLMATRTRGNSESEQFRAEAEQLIRGLAHRWTFGADIHHGRDGGQTSISNRKATVRFDRFFTAKEFYYLKATLENDRYKDLRLRSQTGAGLGYQIFEDETMALDARLGASHVIARHYVGARESYPAANWGLDFRLRPSQIAAEVFHVQDGTRRLDGPQGTVLQTKTGVRVPLGNRVSATAQINADWESHPAPGRRQTDTMLLLGLDYGLP